MSSIKNLARSWWFFSALSGTGTSISADTNPRSETHSITDGGHFCYREHSEMFNQVIKAFAEK